MAVKFYDLQNVANPKSGQSFATSAELIETLISFRIYDSFFCEIVGEQSKLIVGLGPNWSCVQFCSTDALPPYWMATGAVKDQKNSDLEFLIDDTLSFVPFRYALSIDELRQVLTAFVNSESRAPEISWEEI
jgi:hypothetical protein